MWGSLHVIPSSMPVPSKRILGHLYKHHLVVLNAPPSIETIESAIGGSISPIPDFDTILHGGASQPCMAFCNRDALAMDFMPNIWANLLWLQALVRKHGFAEAHEIYTSHPETHHTITGAIAILWGDSEFMQALNF